MNTGQCWEIIEAARADVNIDWSRCDSETEYSLDALLGDALVARLSRLTPPEIVAFEIRFSELQGMVSAQPAVHKAVYLMTLGTGDDGFTDFCAGIVGLGRHWHGLVVADPDNLADHPAVRLMAEGKLDKFTFQAESVQFAPYTAHEEVTGDQDGLYDEVDRLSEPTEDEEEEPETGPVRLPRLEALFAANHAILLDRFGDGDIDYSHTMKYDARQAVNTFNDCINRRDLDGLTALMTDDHTFVDAAGATVTGREQCTEAWRGFFAAFPDYRNRFDHVEAVQGVVTVDGRSECSEPALDGPARWTAVVRADKIARWQVDDVPDRG